MYYKKVIYIINVKNSSLLNKVYFSTKYIFVFNIFLCYKCIFYNSYGGYQEPLFLQYFHLNYFMVENIT